MDLKLIADQFLQLDLTPFVVAILVGGTIGLEREIHGRPAGLRTHALVCLSSAILIQASQVLPLTADDTALAQRIVFDPNRLGAGVVTGIGFLGAAAVIRAGDLVRGITTGACVWAVACLGVVIGNGHYALALFAAVAMLVVLVVFDRLFIWVTPVVYRRLRVRGQAGRVRALSDELRGLLREHGVKIQDVHCELEAQTSRFHLVLHIRCRNKMQAAELVEAACALEGVEDVEWCQSQ